MRDRGQALMTTVSELNHCEVTLIDDNTEDEMGVRVLVQLLAHS